MPATAASVEKEYEKNPQLKKEDIQALQEWAEKQPHLPKGTELDFVLVLQSSYFSIEAAKVTIDKYCTMIGNTPEFFVARDANVNQELRDMMDVLLFAPISRPLPNGFRILHAKLMDTSPSNFYFDRAAKIVLMMAEIFMFEEGTNDGLVIVVDVQGGTFSHLTRVNLLHLKKFIMYIQDAAPIRLKQIHFINLVPVMDKVMIMIRPFVKKEIYDSIYLHPTMDSFYKFIPLEYMPEDYGGNEPSVKVLHNEMKERLMRAGDWFTETEGRLKVDESKRVGKSKNEGEVFGMDGSFKKLDID